MSQNHEFLYGDVVSVNVPNVGKREGLVIGTTIDLAGRQIVEIQFEHPTVEVYKAWYPYVTRVRRYAGYPHHHHYHPGQRTVERRVDYIY